MSEPPESLIYRVGDIDVDTTRGCILRGGQEIPLKPKVFRVLLHFLKERDRLVSKEELLNLFWTDTAVTDDALTQCIARVRHALGDDPRNPVYLKTVPRMGYRFVGSVQEIASGESTPECVPASALPTPKPSGGKPWRIGWVLAGILVAASICGAGFWTGMSLYRPLPSALAKRVIVALPFENRSGQSELDWLREGLPEMLATTLSQSRSIDVVMRSSKSKAAMTGSFSKLGNSMRIDVRIYDTRSGSVLASGSITVEHQDRLLSQVDFLAARLGNRLSPHTSDQESCAPASPLTDNLEAYRYYSLGLQKADAMLTDEAIALFEKALTLDPGFVMARARIGYAYILGSGGPPYLEKGRLYLEKAFRDSHRLTERDRRHIIAWYALANQDYQAAIQRYTELLNEYPNDTEAYFRLAGLLRGEARHEEALEFLHRANAIDPEDPRVYNLLSAVSSEMGRHADAIAMAERYLALAPGDANAYDSLGLSYYMAGQHEQALEAYGKALALKPDFGVVSLHRALAYAAMGRVGEGVSQSLLEAAHPNRGTTTCRGRDQATYLLWRSGDVRAAKELEARSPANCDPRLSYLVLGTPTPTATFAFASSSVGRGARFGRRTGYFYLAENARQQGRTEERLSQLRQLLRVKPGWGELEIHEDALAEAYLELGRTEDAIREYERALRLFPGVARARYHLAKAHLSKGQAYGGGRSWFTPGGDIRSEVPER